MESKVFQSAKVLTLLNGVELKANNVYSGIVNFLNIKERGSKIVLTLSGNRRSYIKNPIVLRGDLFKVREGKSGELRFHANIERCMMNKKLKETLINDINNIFEQFKLIKNL